MEGTSTFGGHTGEKLAPSVEIFPSGALGRGLGLCWFWPRAERNTL